MTPTVADANKSKEAKNVLHSYRGFLLELHLKYRQLMVICIDNSKSRLILRTLDVLRKSFI